LALSPAFSLLHSEFNEFLYAPIGEEPNGVALSVISALTRLGLDPWEEAARLSGLREDVAIQTLTARIVGFPGGGWTQPDARGIATRLVALLPYASVGQAAETGRQRKTGAFSPSRWLTWIAIGVLSVLTWSLLF
jgi:hypothetical protein